MKVRSLMVSMLACAALAGCSNDEIIEEGGNPTLNQGDKAYMTVRIASPGDIASRATAGDYDKGEDTERKVGKTQFFFYNKERFVAMVEKDFTGSTGKVEEGTNVSDTTTIELLLDKTQLKPDRLITLVNLPSGINLASLQSLKKSEMIAKVDALTGYDTDDKFFMSSSSYNQDGTEADRYYGTDVNNKLKTTAEEAKKNPVNIYVERAAAKVKVTFEKSTTTLPSQIVNGKETIITVTLKQWGLTGTNKNANLIKNVSILPTWADGKTDSRSFWAVDDDYSTGEGNYAFKYADGLSKTEGGDIDYSSTWNGDEFSLNYISADQANLAANTADYCLENTSNIELKAGEKNPYTSAVIIAEISVADNEEDILKYEGAYFTASTLKNIALNELKNYRKKVGEGESAQLVALDATDIKYEDAHADNNNEVFFTLTGTTYYTDAEEETEANLTTMKELIGKKALGTAEYFKGGLCSYIVPIEHFGTGNGEDDAVTGKYGVVRNHSYVLNISDIKNIGEGIYKPGDPIIPTTPPVPVDYYLAAQLHVLSWKLVSQDVIL